MSTSTPARKTAKAPRPRTTLAETMAELEAAGSAQTRKTYTRHGATGPMFGVSFATLKTMTKRIDVDHELALALWDTDNFDARNLAVKIVDPARMTSPDLDRWVGEAAAPRLGGGYVAMLAGEGPHGPAKLESWLSAADERVRGSGWTLLGYLAQRDLDTPNAWFEDLLARIEATIHQAPNAERDTMNSAVILIGCRNSALRDSATAAARRIGKVEIDQGDTDCKTAVASESIAKAWAWSTEKGFPSPAAQERGREVPRRRC